MLRLAEQAFDGVGAIDLAGQAAGTIEGAVRSFVGSGITRYINGQSIKLRGTGKPLKGAKVRWKVQANSKIDSTGTLTFQLLTGDTEDTCTEVLMQSGPITAANVLQGDFLVDGYVDKEAKSYIKPVIVLSAAVTSGSVYSEISHFGN